MDIWLILLLLSYEASNLGFSSSKITAIATNLTEIIGDIAAAALSIWLK